MIRNTTLKKEGNIKRNLHYLTIFILFYRREVKRKKCSVLSIYYLIIIVVAEHFISYYSHIFLFLFALKRFLKLMRKEIRVLVSTLFENCCVFCWLFSVCCIFSFIFTPLSYEHLIMTRFVEIDPFR